MKKVIWLLVIILLTAMLGCGVAVYEGESEAGAAPELVKLKQDLFLSEQRNQDLLMEKQDLITEKGQLISKFVHILEELKEAGLPIHLEELDLEIIDELAVEERENVQTINSAAKAEFKDDSNVESTNEEDVR